jgi:hypothetical protein
LTTLFFLINPIFFIFFWYEFYFWLFFIYHFELFEVYYYKTKGLFLNQHIAHFFFCLSFVLLLKNNLLYFLIYGFLSTFIEEVILCLKILFFFSIFCCFFYCIYIYLM